ncbi:multicopper oxidase domain-containing protein [Metabacillus malikii]|uniref:Copper-containing nitrite reductase n=1 Tax=Metabacillus malikii TaxID=1504265 RepID=A0ABT9ZAK0_9BACI|nr:multicopper oxidase domain-containing protein [Metabacillus malikii]MDQ0229274.1 nitrite reductase (NO-forming) [Metabacillus malikii]
MEINYKKLIISNVIGLTMLAGCATNEPPPTNISTEETVFKPHEGVNQSPIPLEINRLNENEVQINMTAQITDIEIDKGVFYKAWTFNGEAPGPVIVVKEGDFIHFSLKNMDPAVPHSMDFHAVHAAPSEKFIDVMPNESGTFTYEASKPGVFMYHCGTEPVLQHIANGMHGVMIVTPKGGYETDKEIAREYVLIQNEWYDYNNLESMKNEEPTHVVFSTKALKTDELNTNGNAFSLKEMPLQAKVGEKVRLYLNNVGPNETSSLHVVGTIFDDVYIDGNPANHLEGMQTVLLPASGGAVVEFTVKEAGTYPIVTHQFNHAEKGAIAHLEVTN